MSDPSVAKITNFGGFEALKEGQTTITAAAYGQKVSKNFIVKQLESEADTTKDITISSNNNNGGMGSSGGGCNTLSGTLILLSVIALFTKKR